MRTQKNAPLIIILAMFLGACATILPGNDPVVVSAERLSTSAHDTFDSFLSLEFNNKAYVKANLPEVHTFAENLRRNRQSWEMSLRGATKAYKSNRNEENKADIKTATAVLSEALRQIPIYTQKINTLSP